MTENLTDAEVHRELAVKNFNLAAECFQSMHRLYRLRGELPWWRILARYQNGVDQTALTRAGVYFTNMGLTHSALAGNGNPYVAGAGAPGCNGDEQPAEKLDD